MLEKFNVPFTIYKRPYGATRLDYMQIPNQAGMQEKMHEIEQLGLRFTLEDVGGALNICLEDDFFDYRCEITSEGPHILTKVASIIMDFDAEDFNAMKAMVEQ